MTILLDHLISYAEIKYFELTTPTTGIYKAPASLGFLGYAEKNDET